MRKLQELEDPSSCMSKAFGDEMTFVLLGRDPAAPKAIRAWVQERIRLGKNLRTDGQITEALACAHTMEVEHGHKPRTKVKVGRTGLEAELVDTVEWPHNLQALSLVEYLGPCEIPLLPIHAGRHIVVFPGESVRVWEASYDVTPVGEL